MAIIRDFKNKTLSLEKVEDDNGEHGIIFYDGVYYVNPTLDALLDLRDCIENTILNFNSVNDFIDETNDRIFNISMSMQSHKIKVKKEEIIKFGFVYIAKCERTNLYKIGSTFKQNVEKRIKQLRTSNPNIIYIDSFPIGSIKEEYMWHKEFDSKRIDGEWFELSLDDIDLIKKYYTTF